MYLLLIINYHFSIINCELPFCILSHVRIELNLLQRNRQELMLALKAVVLVLIEPLYTIGGVSGDLLTLLLHSTLGIAPANQILEAYSLVAEFQALLGLDIAQRNRGEWSFLSTGTNLVIYSSALAVLPAFR